MPTSCPVSVEKLREKLKLKNFEVKTSFVKKHPNADKYLKLKGFSISDIRERSAKLLGAGALAGALLLSPPMISGGFLSVPSEIIEKLSKNKESHQDLKVDLPQILNSILPEIPRPLDRNEEKLLEQIFKQALGIETRATLEGEHLNTTYGYIGAEQHLYRYPGDELSNHSAEETILQSGIAPGLGAWGYFANSKQELTPDLTEKEKWYAVVQTLYLPDWAVRSKFLKQWYKYRKVLIVDVPSGNAVVASIADSGPAAWTGKHFGGSPEVMNSLGGSRYKKGRVLLFFLDDPENKIPLGPVTPRP